MAGNIWLSFTHSTETMMPKPVARYAVFAGEYGAEMPYPIFTFEATTRKEMANQIRFAIGFNQLPKSLFADVKITRLWSFIKRHGSSTAHFSLHHGKYVLKFEGMTEEEYQETARFYSHTVYNI